MNRLGIVTGLLSEARCLNRIPLAQRPPVRCAGADAGRAKEAAGELISAGCEGLMSFGLAAGLSPGLSPGTVVLASSVGAPGAKRYPTSNSWRTRLGQALIGAVDIRTGDIAGSGRLLTSAADKQILRAATGASAADMESLAVAEAAAQAGIPFMAVRAVADCHDRDVPPWVMDGVNPDGGIRHWAMAWQLATQPGDLPAVAKLARDNWRALSALRRVASLAGPFFGFGQASG